MFSVLLPVIVCMDNFSDLIGGELSSLQCAIKSRFKQISFPVRMSATELRYVGVYSWRISLGLTWSG